MFISLFNGELNPYLKHRTLNVSPKHPKANMEFVLNSRAIVQIDVLLLNKLSYWSKRAFNALRIGIYFSDNDAYKVRYAAYFTNICQTKAVSYEISDLAGTIEGVNMTFPPVPKLRLPSLASDLYKHSFLPAPL